MAVVVVLWLAVAIAAQAESSSDGSWEGVGVGARECVDATTISEDELLAVARSSGVTDHTVERSLHRFRGAARREQVVQLLLDAPGIDDKFRCCDVVRWTAADLTAAKFAELEAQRRPFIVRGGIDHWQARNWSAFHIACLHQIYTPWSVADAA